MEQIIFSTRQFHLWPFENFIKWRGFYPTYTICINENGIDLQLKGKTTITLQPNEIEACTIEKTWLGFGKLKIGFSSKYGDYKKEIRGDQWYIFSNKFSYIDPKDKKSFILALKEVQAKCFNCLSISLLHDTVWMSNEYIIEYDGKSKFHFWALSIPALKYYYTENSVIPFKKNLLVTGADYPLKIKKLNRSDVDALRQHIISNGAKLGEISNATFKDAKYFSWLINPKLWFTHVKFGLGDEGITYSQKTFKTNEQVFLPYEKINCVISNGKWYWFFTRNLFIYGEQNIVPQKKLWASDAKRIVNELKEKGVSEFEGESFTASYHSNALGIILNIVTIGIWHLIVMIFSRKRQSIIIGEKMISYTGDIWLWDLDKFRRYKAEGIRKFFTGSVTDVKAVCYRKKHWYHFWGKVYVWVRPTNIRGLAYEASQGVQDYDLELGKVFLWTAKAIRKTLKNAGFEEDSKTAKIYKEFISTLKM